jgi:hypothetical protein
VRTKSYERSKRAKGRGPDSLARSRSCWNASWGPSGATGAAHKERSRDRHEGSIADRPAPHASSSRRIEGLKLLELIVASSSRELEPVKRAGSSETEQAVHLTVVKVLGVEANLVYRGLSSRRGRAFGVATRPAPRG